VLGLFTGLVAGVEYFALCVYFLPPLQTVSSEWRFFVALQPAFSKAMFLVISGVMAGFVGRELRTRLLTSLQIAREKNRVVGMFGQYVSPAVVQKLLEQKSAFSGEVRHVTIVFLDIRGFTEFSETRSPTEVVAYLNTLFGYLITIVNSHDGIINKFLGDGFMAVFGAPISNGKDAVNAVNAALAMANTVDELNASATIPPTRIGIGIHTGSAVTGNVGSEERKEYTIIGDTVNLASRVEQLNKEFSSTILVTADVAALLDNSYTKEPLPAVFVKGRAEAVTLYKLR
jgi:adenylate cyclase